MVEPTPTERRLLVVLADGMPHHREELLPAVDELASMNSLKVHLCKLRRKLRPEGTDIICEFKGRGFFYRHIRLLASPYDGRK